MTDAQRIEHSVQKDDDLRRQVKRVNIALLFVLLALLAGPIGVSWWLSQRYPSISTVSIADMRVVGETALCPGEPLVIEYDFHAGGSGVLVRDATLWSMEPPRTVIFSTSRRFILEGPIDQHLRETWHVPDVHVNPETDQWEPLKPGHYRRLTAISSPSNRIVVAISGVDFTIREDCRG